MYTYRRFNILTASAKRALTFLAICGGATSPLAPAATTTPVVQISVDAQANRHFINPYIYGINFGTTETLYDLRATVNRAGGDSASMYNWRLDARNAGSDWYFESVPVDVNDPNNQFGGRFVASTMAGSATPIITLPMIGRVAKVGTNNAKLASYSLAKYGAQTGSDAYFPDAGTGVYANGTMITNNNPDDATTTDSAANEQARVTALVQQFGTAMTGGVRYYAMDNEPSLWQNIHRDVHATGAHASEIANSVITYSAAVKAADSGAKVVAPEEWGWGGYFHSGYDQQYTATHGYAVTPPDATNQTGGMDYVPWLLKTWKAAGHPIDVFSLHFYPQSGEYSADANSQTTALMLQRNVSTRDLWDKQYKDPTWINSVVALIPTMRSWVNKYYYVGTPIAITEYNWGGDTIMNGATAQADILGIFGREGLDMATRWGTIDSTMPVYKAFKLYRNYDGKGSGFGSTSIAATVPNPDNVSAFAAIRSDKAVTVMLINKQLNTSANVNVSLANMATAGTAQVWQLASNATTRLSDTSYSSGQLNMTVPAQSVTLLVLPNAAQ
ncbi:glycoside hydrolase family 44 protein [Robbsia sp. KACC 23696]|uniref:glycoside hydrolase family 44 protein n=1 Tax=Robbsia sp. KACC 23696 TaxID=3149231 RepID=UPI00325C2FAB